ncbi:hypothetical protein [Rhizobacter fulvus]
MTRSLPKSASRFSRAQAIHEAAHAVARVYVGAEIGSATVTTDGGGFVRGTGEPWKCRWSGQHAGWAYLLVLFAGGYAEARVSKRAAATVFLTNAKDDAQEAQQSLEMLVAQAFASDQNAAWLRAEADTREFLKGHWPAIERVADALQADGHVSASELVNLVELAPQQS